MVSQKVRHVPAIVSYVVLHTALLLPYCHRSAPLTSPGHLLFSGPYQQPDEPTFFGGCEPWFGNGTNLVML